jgi:hypothetical protein
VKQGIGIGVALKAQRMGNFNAAQYQLATRNQAMNIVTVSYSIHNDMRVRRSRE